MQVHTERGLINVEAEYQSEEKAKTDEYYGFLETGKINVEGSIETTYGSYPTADTIVDGFMMLWQHE